MRWITAMVLGALAGITLMLSLYAVVLVVLWFQSRGASDAITATVMADHGELINRTVVKFLLLNFLAGSVLGAGAGLLREIIMPSSRAATSGRKRFLSYLCTALAIALYMNVRLIVAKPMFYDPMLNACGGVGQWLQNLLTGYLSPTGVDLLLVIALVVWALRVQRSRKKKGVLIAAILIIATLSLIPGPWEMEEAKTGPSTPGKAGLPNILLLACDSLRPDHLGCNGYERDTSPRIDELAKKSVCFDQAYVPLARTLPSWISLFTSTYPHTHGFRHMFPGREKRTIHLPILPRILDRAGYTTAVISDYAGECFDMVDMGFDTQDVPPSTSIPLLIEREFVQKQPFLVPFLLNRAGYRLLPLLGFMMINPDPDRMADKVIRKLNGRNPIRRPFFITAFFSCTHIPYSAPYPYYKKFTDPDYKGIHKYGFGILNPEELEEALKRPPEIDQRHIVDLYDGGVAAFDHGVGRILDALHRLGLADNTLVVITSDHGENLYENDNLLEHGERFGGGDHANRCPVIFYDPTHDFSARHIDAPVSTLDLMPTLISLLDLPRYLAGRDLPRRFIEQDLRLLATQFATLQGRDLVPLLQGKTLPLEPLLAETGLRLGGSAESLAGTGLEYPSILSSLLVEPLDGTLVLDPRLERRFITSKARQIRTDHYKLIYIPIDEGADFHLYDVQTDPDNRVDLHGREGFEEITRQLKQALFKWMLEEPGSGLDRSLHLIRQYTFFE